MNMNHGDERPVLKTFVAATARTLTVYATTETGAVKDLSGFNGATISAKLGDTYKLSRLAMTIADAAGGVLTFIDAAGDLDAPGEYDAQVRLTTAGGAEDFLEDMTLLVEQPIDDIP